MIGRLRGRLLEKRPTELVVEVAGTGYEASIPVSTYAQLPRVGEEVTLITHLHVREDLLQLYAFASAAERRLFRTLIGVSGVGPKLALAVLSGLSVADFGATVAAGDADRLRAIPGIGKRTAERLVVELRDRLETAGAAAPEASGVPAGACDPVTFRDAVATLSALGYAPAAARQAARRALEKTGPGPALEELVRRALDSFHD